MAGVDTAPHMGEPRLLNRQLSWLAFNRRVLALAEDTSLPFADRMRFVSIWARNLDEYYQVRIASLRDEAESGWTHVVDDGYTAHEQLDALREVVAHQSLEARHIASTLWRDVAAEGVELHAFDELSVDDQSWLRTYFRDNVFPVLTPIAVDAGQPFPYISTLSLSLGMILVDPATRAERFARVKVPADLIGRHIQVADTNRYVLVEQLIASSLSTLFPVTEVLEVAFFRVTRDADIDVTIDLLDDFDDDLLSAVEMGLRQRRFGAVTRLEIEAGASEALRQILREELDVDEDSIYEISGPVDLASYCDLDPLVEGRPGFVLPTLQAATPALFSEVSGPDELFARLREQDQLVFHPYDSFDLTVEAFIEAAAADPEVQAIKMTLYRTGGDGAIVESLVRAAESGKQVVVVVELKARFDEAANISWARRLETAGVHVSYGFVALKVHAKVCLVVRREGRELRSYCHMGTGNYNSRTAGLYTDIGLFTAEPSFGSDLSQLFNSLTGVHAPVDYEQLFVAPSGLRGRLIGLIELEAEHGSNGRIVMKMNSLVDTEMIEALYAASSAGVRIELIVRGICCLRPGVAGMSENITVRSIVGRYLEHPRAFWFLHGDHAHEAQFLIGSADLMTRNLDRRVEALAPVYDPDCQAQMIEYFETNLRDDRRAWTLAGSGAWSPPDPTGSHEMHVEMHAWRSHL